MDAELYTWTDAIVFFLLYYRRLIWGLLLLADVYLFTRWKTSLPARLGAVMLALAVLGGIGWEVSILL